MMIWFHVADSWMQHVIIGLDNTQVFADLDLAAASNTDFAQEDDDEDEDDDLCFTDTRYGYGDTGTPIRRYGKSPKTTIRRYIKYININ